MKKAIIYTLVTVVVCCGHTPIVRAESPALHHILITEIQTGGASDATEEFVELYNPNDVGVDVTGWQLQYRAASQTAALSWPGSSTKATLSCAAGSAPDCTMLIAPQGRLVLVHTLANIAGALPMSGGFSDKGGEIRFIQPGSPITVQDYIGYGTAADFEGTAAAPAPAAGQSIKRVLDANNLPIDTDTNSADFIAGCGSPTPGVADSTLLPYSTGCAAPTDTPPTPPVQDGSTDIPQPSDPTPPSNPNPSPDPPTTAQTPDDSSVTPGQGAGPLTYLPVLISEALPDPAPPQQDATDEFIELYNPNETAITLANYTLQTGQDWHYHFTLGDTPLGPHQYLALDSAVTNLSLANSGSGVRLLDPNGQIAAEAPNYGSAKEGQSWMQDDTGWHWTLTPTPSAPNILTIPVAKITAAPATATAKKKTATKTTTKTKTPALKAPKAPAAKKSSSIVSPATTTASASTPVQYWLLIPIGAIALSYAIYEYRVEIAKFARALRTKLFRKTKLIVPREPNDTD